MSKQKAKLVIIILFLAVILLISGWYFVMQKVTGNTVPQNSGQNGQQAKLPPPQLPKDFPAEFTIDKSADLKIGSTTDGRTTAVFLSKLAPKDLLAAFVSSIESKGWKVMSQNGDDSQTQAFASYSQDKSPMSTVDFRATKLPNGSTEVYIAYLK